MSKRKHGRKLLGLLVVAALGVMAFASAAQALTPEFLVAKKLPAAGLDALVSGKIEEKTVGTLLIPGLNVEINCTGFTVQEGLIANGVDAKAKLLYEGCTALEEAAPLGELAGCEIVNADAESPAAKQIGATALILPTELNDGTFAVLAEGIVATVLTKPEQGCLLPTTTKIKGEVCFKIAAGNDTVEPLIESNKTIQGECVERTALEGLTIGKGFKDKLLFGTQEAFVDGKAKLFLIKAHEGLTLGVSLQ